MNIEKKAENNASLSGERWKNGLLAVEMILYIFANRDVTCRDVKALTSDTSWYFYCVMNESVPQDCSVKAKQ